MAINSPHHTLSFVVLPCVCYSTYFNEYGNKIFDALHAVFIVLVENKFIVDEHNDMTCHFGDNFNRFFDDKHTNLRIFR